VAARVLRFAVLPALVAALWSAGVGRGQSAGPEFADWTAITGTTSLTGTLLGHPIALTGGSISPAGGSVLDGSSTLFADTRFSPSLPLSDAPEFRATDPPYSYVLSFGAPVVDPILHLHSVGSVLTFPSGARIVKRSGDAGLIVNGNVVSSTPGPPDEDGTIQLTGTFEAIAFTARYTEGPLDGIGFQVGGTAVPAVTPAPTATPVATATPSPSPLAGRSVVTRVASGQVLVQAPSGGDFTPVQGAVAVPVGAVVDARKGSLVLESSVAGDVQSATIAAGIFRIRQQRGGPPELVLLTPPGQARACASKRTRPAKGVVRALSVNVSKGVIRTLAMKGTITGRAAAWTTADRCDGTVTTVRRGRVSVRAGRRTVVVRAGHSYRIRARLFAAKTAPD
jgi:hypothetical protein